MAGIVLGAAVARLRMLAELAGQLSTEGRQSLAALLTLPGEHRRTMAAILCLLEEERHGLSLALGLSDTECHALAALVLDVGEAEPQEPQPEAARPPGSQLSEPDGDPRST